MENGGSPVQHAVTMPTQYREHASSSRLQTFLQTSTLHADTREEGPPADRSTLALAVFANSTVRDSHRHKRLPLTSHHAAAHKPASVSRPSVSRPSRVQFFGRRSRPPITLPPVCQHIKTQHDPAHDERCVWRHTPHGATILSNRGTHRRGCRGEADTAAAQACGQTCSTASSLGPEVMRRPLAPRPHAHGRLIRRLHSAMRAQKTLSPGLRCMHTVICSYKSMSIPRLMDPRISSMFWGSKSDVPMPISSARCARMRRSSTESPLGIAPVHANIASAAGGAFGVSDNCVGRYSALEKWPIERALPGCT